MRKNTILYFLLIVLIIMNGFFLFNYLGRPNHKGPKENNDFIVKELNLTQTQLETFKASEFKHHKAMEAISKDLRSVKEVLFKNITKPSVKQTIIDSLVVLISEKEKLKEKEMFYRIRGIYELCDEQQKKQFSEIIKKARMHGNKGPKRP